MLEFLKATPDSGRGDPFSSLWDAFSLTRQRSLLQRVSVIAATNNIPLYLFWGTLIGHVREGRILPWDDDVDLALFEPDRYPALRTALHSAGLITWHISNSPDNFIKICDPAHATMANRPWTWPFIDLFIHSGYTQSTDDTWPPAGLPRALVLPGRPVSFEGARYWEPEQPLAILDLQYESWRALELTSNWNHREERSNSTVYARWIKTDPQGRKIA